MNKFFEPLGKFPISKSKYKTLQNFDFTLSIEPTTSKFPSICEKIFDPMLSGSIPVYYGQKILKNIPENTFIRINRKTSVKNTIKMLENITSERKEKYRKDIYKFLKSNLADKYRYDTYANLIINTIKSFK